MTPEMIDDILSIQSECGLSPWTSRGYLAELRRPDAVMIAASLGGEVAGFLVGRTPLPTPASSPDAEIYNIGTRPRFRRKGIGSALLASFLQICDERGTEAIWLDVRASNVAAKAFYLQHGFVKTGSRKGFYTHPDEDADLMCRKRSAG
jgi:ribosomal-protein-alanine N-acetyltransferase